MRLDPSKISSRQLRDIIMTYPGPDGLKAVRRRGTKPVPPGVIDQQEAHVLIRLRQIVPKAPDDATRIHTLLYQPGLKRVVIPADFEPDPILDIKVLPERNTTYYTDSSGPAVEYDLVKENML